MQFIADHIWLCFLCSDINDKTPCSLAWHLGLRSLASALLPDISFYSSSSDSLPSAEQDSAAPECTFPPLCLYLGCCFSLAWLSLSPLGLNSTSSRKLSSIFQTWSWPPTAHWLYLCYGIYKMLLFVNIIYYLNIGHVLCLTVNSSKARTMTFLI